MDPISANMGAQALQNPETAFSKLPAHAPDASDVRQFQDAYWQDGSGAISGQDGIGQLLQAPESAQAGETVFQRALERMVEVHENGCAKLETLVDRITGSGNIAPAQLIEVQLALADATTGLATYQSFDKKTDEGVKVLMTGQ